MKPTTKNQFLHISKCVITHVQPCRISKIFMGVTPLPPASRAGEGARRETRKKRKRRMGGKGREGRRTGIAHLLFLA